MRVLGTSSTSRPRDASMRLWHRLLRCSASESGRLRHGGTGPRGARPRPKVVRVAYPLTAEIGQRLDTSKNLMAVDVGGATGSLLYSLMQMNPSLHGIVSDRPEHVSRAQAAAISLGLSGRSTAVTGDFFESVPEGDLYLLRFILHDWNDDDCIRILKNCRSALLPGGRLIIVESFLGRVGQEVSHDVADIQGAIIDLHMFVVAGGRERSVSEYRTLLELADLSIVATTPLPSGYVLMEARARTEGLPSLANQKEEYNAEALWPFG